MITLDSAQAEAAPAARPVSKPPPPPPVKLAPCLAGPGGYPPAVLPAMAAHPHVQTDGDDAAPGLDRQKEREERQARRMVLKEFRQPVAGLPTDALFEIPGRPTVLFQIKDYSKPDAAQGRAAARQEVPFLFKAFETGQQPPPRPGTKKAEQPRAATIHEYLDWTVTASEPEDPDELDFAGFRIVALLPRFSLLWPPPGCRDGREVPLKHPGIGAPLPAVPILQSYAKPICAATFRLGPGFMEVPFYATQETRRNKGHGRALLEAVESICRSLSIPLILLCSTDDVKTKSTWQALGFSFTTPEDLNRFGVTPHDLLHMDNTVQMHKHVPPPTPWRSVMLTHGDLRQRLYYLPGACPPPLGGGRLNGPRGLMQGVPKKPPKKKRKR